MRSLRIPPSFRSWGRRVPEHCVRDEQRLRAGFAQKRYPIVKKLVHPRNDRPNSTQRQRAMARTHCDIRLMRQTAVAKAFPPPSTP